ncbi:hypothetical protein DdX_21300 [Ditylenchus destructor]|uniref:Uncharacterized protein n=1 Tax=Ditylenchus destructor TaxID=166010 RepID=A0AAD4QT46_9BILA|nr:hypothetical protein DdX_21300 [Ditylenchus destructor]
MCSKIPPPRASPKALADPWIGRRGHPGVPGMAFSCSADRLAGLRPIGEEAFDPLVGQRVLDELADHCGRRGHHVRAELRRLQNVDGMTHRCDEDLGTEIVIVIDQADIADQFHAVEADIVVRPTKGETKVAPALAASSAWFAEKQRVTFTIVPSSVSALQVLRPSIVSGTLTATLSAIFRTTSASRIMPSWSSATTSAETGPSTILQNLGHHFQEVAPRLVDQRGVGGDAVEQPRLRQLANVVGIGGYRQRTSWRGLLCKCVTVV